MFWTVGGHRLWAHRSFKTRLPFRILLVILQTMTMNGSAFSYARDHRTHHKHSDTEADPKNPSAGLLYAHIGWWCFDKSSIVKDAGSKLDFSDLTKDWGGLGSAPLVQGAFCAVWRPASCGNSSPLLG